MPQPDKWKTHQKTPQWRRKIVKKTSRMRLVFTWIGPESAGSGTFQPVKTAHARKGFDFCKAACRSCAGTGPILFSQKVTSSNVRIGRRSDMRKMIAMAVAGFVWRQLRSRILGRRQAGRMARRRRF